MKVCTIVGLRKSGKTSTVTALVEAIRARGQRVGTCKTVFCPTFSMDQPDSNTARHAAAGAELVCARAKHETTLIYPQMLPLSRVLSLYEGFDYVLLEGDYRAPVPRLVAAHAEADALQRMNDLTIGFVGRISRAETELPLPKFDALGDADTLLRYMDEHVPDITLSEALDVPLPPVEGVTDDGFCQCGCHRHQRKHASVEVTVDGRTLALTDEQRALLRQWAAEAQP